MLRRVEPDDIAVFFEQQADPPAAAMAAFPSRDRVAHDEHWARILGDSSCVARAIVLPDGQIVGNIGSFDVEGERHVGYWIGREHWGQGHASRALTEFVAEFPERPLSGVLPSTTPPACGCLPSAASLSSVRHRKQATRPRRSSCD